MVSKDELASASKILSWISTGKTWALAFVAVGVALEFFADRIERPYLRKVELAHEEEMEGLKVRIAEAEQRAAEANLELLKFKTPRTISLEQADRMKPKLKALSGQHFDVETYTSKRECIDFSNAIIDLLVAAGWLASGGWPPENKGLQPIRLPILGLEVVTGKNADARTKRASDSFRSIFSAEGLAVSVGIIPHGEATSIGSDVVRIRVGEKP